MEDLNRYIESGILERYVLGDVTPDERREVEQAAKKYAKVRQEILEIELALENFAQAHGIEPAKALKGRVLSGVGGAEESSEVRVLNKPTRSQRTFYPYALAASVALLLISWVALIIVYNRLDESKEQLALSQRSSQQYSMQVNQYDQQLQESQKVISVLKDPAVRMITLRGTDRSPSSKLRVVYQPDQEIVMLDLSSLALPANDSAHQYQLWAMVEGKPVDLGVFDADRGVTGMKEMKGLANAEAFAVTLESRGGSPVPTMSNLMALGTI